MVYLNYKQAYSKLHANILDNVQNIQKIFWSLTESEAKGLNLALEGILNDKKVIELFEKKKRRELASYLVPLFKNRLKPEYGIKQFQFHIPEATSFLRVHKPSKFGDDLSSFRRTVVFVNRNIKPAIGIEVGRGGPGLRVVLPVFGSKHQHLGSVEFGGSLKSILQSLAKTYNIRYSIAIKKDVFAKARRFQGKKTDIKKDDLIYYEYSDEEAYKLTKNLHSISEKLVIDGDFAIYSFPIYDFLDNVVGYITIFTDITKEHNEIDDEVMKSSIYILGTSILLSLVLVLILKMNLDPLNQFVYVLDSLTEEDKGGDLTKRIEIKNYNEVGKASASINRFIELTMRLIDEIKKQSETAVHITSKVERFSRELKTSTSKQITLLKQIEDRSAKVKSTAIGSSDRLNEVTSTIFKESKMISNILDNLTDVKNKMMKISSDELELSSDMDKLSREVQQVYSITELIDSIADQTNLLALNASIEASRAGKFGRGFSVVAEEIHKLSGETQKALNQINDKIGQLVSSVKSVSSTILTNSKNIENSSKDIQSIHREANILLTTSYQTVRQADSSKKSSEYIADIVEELHEDIKDLLEIAEKNSNAYDELFDIIHNMSNSMNQLKHKMDMFKTEGKEDEKLPVVKLQ